MKTAKNLNAAIKSRNSSRVKELLDQGVVPDERSVFLAIERRAHDILKLILMGGADANAVEPYWKRTPVIKAIKVEDETALSLLLDHGASPNVDCYGGPPLVSAASKGWVEGIKMLIAKGAEIEQQDCAENTALIVAARMGHLPIVKSLVASGANVGAADKLGRTAHAVAVEEKNEGVAKYLAPLTSVKATSPQNTLVTLLDSIRSQDKAAFERCLAAGADVNGRDSFGREPLRSAIDAGAVVLIKRLIEAGADVNRIDEDGT